MTTPADLARATLTCLDAKERAIAELARAYDRQVKLAAISAEAGDWAQVIADHMRAASAARAIMENEQELAR